MFIAVEGIDAAGKHTQTEKLKEYLEDGCGIRVTKFDLPKYESVTGQMVRDYLVGKWKLAVQGTVQPPFFSDDSSMHELSGPYATDPSTYMFQCCQLVNRLETLPDDLWAWSRGRSDDHIFIADRYNASAFAYGVAFGLDFDWLLRTHRYLPQPTLNIFLDISVEESFNRRPERRDAYERNSKMLHTVRDSYLKIFGKLGPTYRVVDASGTIEQTFDRILEEVRRAVSINPELVRFERV